MAHDEVRRRILARRTRFVAAAIASAGIAASGCCDEVSGEPCLSIAQPEQDGSATEPTVCLKIAPERTEKENETPKVCLTAPMPSSKTP